MTTLERDFATMFGTNPNHANAFGKCVSRRAHGEDLSDAVGGDDEQETCDAAEPPATDGTETGPRARDDDRSDDEATEDEDSRRRGHRSGESLTEEPTTSGSDEPADDEQAQGDDEQGEDDQGQDEDGASGELDSSDLAAALRFLRL